MYDIKNAKKVLSIDLVHEKPFSYRVVHETYCK